MKSIIMLLLFVLFLLIEVADAFWLTEIRSFLCNVWLFQLLFSSLFCSNKETTSSDDRNEITKMIQNDVGGIVQLSGIATCEFPTGVFEQATTTVSVSKDQGDIELIQIIQDDIAIFQPNNYLSYQVKISSTYPPLTKYIETILEIPSDFSIPEGYGIEVFASLIQGSVMESQFVLFELIENCIIFENIQQQITCQIPANAFAPDGTNNNNYVATVTMATTSGRKRVQTTSQLSLKSQENEPDNDRNLSYVCLGEPLQCPFITNDGCNNVLNPFHEENFHPVYGYTPEHLAVDYAATQATPVHAAADGIIEFVDETMFLGGTIVIRHNIKGATRYCHMSLFNVNVGNIVKAGDQIGLSGGTPGSPMAGLASTGPHLHMEYAPDGNFANSKNRIDPHACIVANTTPTVAPTQPITLQPTTQSPTSPPTTTTSTLSRAEQIRNYINSITVSRLLLAYPPVADTAEENALQWLIDIDPAQLPASDEFHLRQRYSIATLCIQSTTTPTDWLMASDECTWPGLLCSDGSAVTSISTSLFGLTGTISPDLALLSNSLVNLDLEGNLFVGTLPESLSELSLLASFIIANNNLTSSIPTLLGMWTSIEVFDVFSNSLVGTVPPELGQWTNLVRFTAENNNLSGTIPIELGLWTSIRLFDVYSNQHTGTIPTEIGAWTDIESFSLANNNFIGPIPSELGMWTSVQTFDVDSNSLNGTIPTESGRWTSIISFLPRDNELSGTIPAELGQWTSIQTFDLYSNLFTGTIPSELGAWFRTGIGSFYLSFNDFSGSIPPELGQWQSVVERFDVAVNSLRGTIPSELGLWVNLNYFDLIFNLFSGIIPTELGQWTAIATFHIRENNFVGTLPNSLGQWSTIESFTTSTNSFTGTVPSSYSNWDSTLRYGLFHHNLLIGSMPLCGAPTLVADCNEIECPCCSSCCPGAVSFTCLS